MIVGRDSICDMINDKTRGSGPAEEGFGFLLVQLGFHAAERFAEALAPLGLEARHVGMLRRLAASEGRSQQAVGEMLGINATRMVFLVDDLEKRGFVERRKNPTDRRSYALYLTELGHTVLEQAAEATRHHESVLGAALSPAERGQLAGLLRRIAAEQGINPRGLPGRPPTAGPPTRRPSEDQDEAT
jgi:DNA-binding MarR family transcriptional regulator